LPLPLPPGDFFSFFRLSAVAGPVCGSLSVSGLPCIWKDGDPRELHLFLLRVDVGWSIRIGELRRWRMPVFAWA
jgi:hypothetical protein